MNLNNVRDLRKVSNLVLAYWSDTQKNRESRRLSGFSMGGGLAFWFAANNPDIFGGVTAYGATFHHILAGKGKQIVGEPLELAEKYYTEEAAEIIEGGVFWLVKKNAEKIRGKLAINIRIGSGDVLICENKVMSLYLTELGIPHGFKVFEGAGHELGKII